MVSVSHEEKTPRHRNCFTLENSKMEKRILGVILSVLGIIGLVFAAVRFAKGISGGGQSARFTIIALVLGGIFFFSGIALVKNTKDKAT